jgi:F0F1-type ATP synthase membrane subunit c/vacuolar-type H+-ATPase subunit K
LLFVKASKLISIAIVLLPITGCALGTGILYGSLIKGISYAPEMENILFNYSSIGFAFIETFAFMCVGAAIFISGF